MTRAKALTGFAVLACLTATLSGCGSSDAPTQFDAKTTQSMQTSLDASVIDIGVPGATMTVIRPDGAKWVGVSGLSNIENNTPVAPGLTFRIASITKTFTATVILQLVQEGRLSLDDKLESVLPGLIPNGAQISVRQLLNHTSGLFDYVHSDNPNFLMGEFSDLFKKWKPEELVAVANANPTYFAPGGGFHYSNTNYVLLGMLIEKITGRPYGQEVAARILVPLGLKNTSVPETSDMPGKSTQGYTYDPINKKWSNTTRFDPSWMFATGNILSDSEDLLVWLNALMEGTLLDQPRRTEMFTFTSISPGSSWGYGLGMENLGGPIGHTGDAVFGGQSAIYQYRGWMFVVLVNASPAKEIDLFGSEYIMFKAMQVLGLMNP